MEQYPVSLRSSQILWIDERFATKAAALRAVLDFTIERTDEFEKWMDSKVKDPAQ